MIPTLDVRGRRVYLKKCVFEFYHDWPSVAHKQIVRKRIVRLPVVKVGNITHQRAILTSVGDENALNFERGRREPQRG